jgi:hypothetical protein
MKDVVVKALRACVAPTRFTIFSLHFSVYNILPFTGYRSIQAKSLG